MAPAARAVADLRKSRRFMKTLQGTGMALEKHSQASCQRHGSGRCAHKSLEQLLDQKDLRP
jgi:hypothetical protein